MAHPSPPAAPALEAGVASEAIIAWRAWALTGRRDGTNLLLRPVAGRTRPWKPREIAEAGCKGARFHRSPDPDCTCGLHATDGLEMLRRARCPAVIGRVAMWGRVVEHEHGFRAEFAYPQRLTLICQFCFWLRGVGRTRPDVVAWFAKDHLIPMCARHLGVAIRHGVRTRTVLDADVIGQRLLDAYAVDRLVL
jgi:hypothetical protein